MAGAEFVDAVGFVAPLVNPVSRDPITLAAEPIPPLHPQLQSPIVISIVTKRNENGLVGLKEAGSVAW